jgi:hypothetical protein
MKQSKTKTVTLELTLIQAGYLKYQLRALLERGFVPSSGSAKRAIRAVLARLDDAWIDRSIDMQNPNTAKVRKEIARLKEEDDLLFEYVMSDISDGSVRKKIAKPLRAAMQRETKKR